MARIVKADGSTLNMSVPPKVVSVDQLQTKKAALKALADAMTITSWEEVPEITTTGQQIIRLKMECVVGRNGGAVIGRVV